MLSTPSLVLPSAPVKKSLGLGVLTLVIGLLLWAFFKAPAAVTTTRPSPLPSAERTLLDSAVQAARGNESIRGVVYDGLTGLEGITLVATRLDDEEDLEGLDCEAPCTHKRLDCGSVVAGLTLVEWAQTRRGEAPPVARTTSRADGSFVLSGLAPGLHRVWASGEGRGVALVLKVAAGEQALELALGNEVEVSGTVSGAEGAPVAGAWVTGFFSNAPHYFHAQTLPDGTFSLGKLPVGASLALVVTTPEGLHGHDVVGPIPQEGFQRLTGRLVLIDLVIPKDHLVRVLHKGSAVSGARVALVEGSHETAWSTNADGEAKVTLLTSNFPKLTATASALVGKATPNDDDEVIVIELEPAQWLEGSVHDEAQRPLQGARLTSGSTATRSDAAGRFTLGPFALSERVIVEASAHGRITAVALQKTPGQRVDFELAPDAPVTGRVLDSEGRPLAGAMVWLKTVGMQEPTGADGVFAFNGTASGGYNLVVSHPVWGNLLRRISAPALGLDLRLPRGGSLDVVVVDEQGRPLRVTVEVAADSRLSGSRGEHRWVETDRLGRASFFGLGSGPYVASASDASARLRVAQRVELQTGGHLEVRLECIEGLPISGRVVDADGRAVPDVWVSAGSEQSADTAREQRVSLLFEDRRRSARDLTDATGAFILPHLPAGPYTVSVAGPAGNVEQLAKAGAADLVLEIPATLHAVGQVLDAQRRPVTTALVMRMKVDPVTAVFRVPIYPGDTHVSVSDDRYPERAIELPSHLPGRDFELGAVVLSTGRSVRVQLVDATSGRGLQGIRFSADPRAASADSLETDVDGFTALTGLGDGEVIIRAEAPGFVSEYVVVASTTTQTRVELQRHAKIVVSVFAAAGHLDQAATVSTLVNGNEVSSEAGTLSVPAGTYQLVVAQGPRRLAIAPVEVSVVAGQTKRVEFREPVGGVSVTFQFVNAHDEGQVVAAALVPVSVLVPASLEAWSTSMEAGLQLRPDENTVLPGSYLLLAHLLTITSEPFVFSQRITITQARDQRIRVVVPTQSQGQTPNP